MGHADEFYDQILTDGSSPKTIFLVLSKLKAEGQLDRVIQASIKALNAYPKDIYIRRLLAETYFEAGLMSQAEAEAEKVIELIADLTDVYKLQARIYRRQERKEEAAEALKVYLAHHPYDEDAHHFLNSLKPEEEGPVGEPRPQAKGISPPLEDDAVNGAPEIATSTLAELYFEQGQIHEAIKTYEILVALNPEVRRFRVRLAELKAMSVEKASVEKNDFDTLRQNKKKMITILESWRANIQEHFDCP